MPIQTSSSGPSEARVTTIAIHRPERRNALNLDTLNELHEAVVDASSSRALVVTGTEGHFCAGADLTELEDISFTERLAEVLDHLACLPITTVAAVEGSCMGLGMQLALACDLRVVAAGAKFAVPVAKLGLMVDEWTINRLVRFWGEGAARHMVLSAAVLSHEDALRLGFAQAQGTLVEAQQLATSVVDLAPLSQSGSKIGFDIRTDADRQRYQDAFATAWASDDLAEGQRAFSERRKPQFRGQ